VSPGFVLESPRIPVPVPPLCQFKTAKGNGDKPYHSLNAADRMTIGQFAKKPRNPAPETVQQSCCSHNHTSPHMPHMPGQVVRRRPCGQCTIDGKQIWQ
jgi:hypothetical protein